MNEKLIFGSVSILVLSDEILNLDPKANINWQTIQKLNLKSKKLKTFPKKTKILNACASRMYYTAAKSYGHF